jgi:hypothetical protein
MDETARAVNDVVERVRRRQTRKHDIGLRADIGGRARRNAADFLEFGERAATKADDAMAAFDQVVGYRQADLADTDEANRLHDPPHSIVLRAHFQLSRCDG